MLDELNKRSQEALIRATVWAFIGSLYGMIYIFFFNLSLHWSLPLNPFLVAGTMAGTLAALIYSSMSLAVIVAAISSICSLFLVVFNGGTITIPYLISTTAVVGAIVGAIYGLKAKQSRIHRADAKTLTGAFSGAVTALVFLILNLLFPSIPLAFTVAMSCLITGSLYTLLVPEFINRFDKLLLPVADGAMVGAGTSIFIGLLFFVMISGVTPEVAGELQSYTEQIRNTFLQAALGGMIGGGIAGFLSGWMLRKWQDL